MFVYFPVLSHVCDVNANATGADLSRGSRLGSVDGNATAEQCFPHWSVVSDFCVIKPQKRRHRLNEWPFR